MILLKSYPKSGNTWIRFILCNLLYPDVEHDFSTIKKYCPTYEDENEIDNAVFELKICKTHKLDITFGNTIYIHRHVGDVLISFWWHCKKFFNEERTLNQFIEDLKFGKGWREFVNVSTLNYIKYEDIDSIKKLIFATQLNYYTEEWISAINKSSFTEIRQIETTKGINCGSDTNIMFTRYRFSGQYCELPKKLKEKILETNKRELKLLGYAN